MIRSRVIVRGLVQGVSFRKRTVQMAEAYGVKGWVRNLPTGEVEGCFEGKKEAVEMLVRWCRLGPERARVTKVDRDDFPCRSEFSAFRIADDADPLSVFPQKDRHAAVMEDAGIEVSPKKT